METGHLGGQRARRRNKMCEMPERDDNEARTARLTRVMYNADVGVLGLGVLGFGL